MLYFVLILALAGHCLSTILPEKRQVWNPTPLTSGIKEKRQLWNPTSLTSDTLEKRLTRDLTPLTSGIKEKRQLWDATPVVVPISTGALINPVWTPLTTVNEDWRVREFWRMEKEKMDKDKMEKDRLEKEMLEKLKEKEMMEKEKHKIIADKLVVTPIFSGFDTLHSTPITRQLWQW